MIKPLNNNVVLLIEKPENKTNSGIILTESATEKTNKAKVIAISDKLKNEDKNLTIKENDIVVYKKYSGVEFKDNDNEYLIVEIEDIIAKL
ncbi:GroES family chaperonin [Spiroplasma turonicum]|uniref:10 kDa chaperonin n=1 Tax=Spiroplasma turonicum TaxID=216946 RepID=A0A0K1P638_9MOLU|nr:co-chaperone GroES [Spiroplasma turonicum]AKU79778.1 chaperonin GroES [Spiroplasma turonicum]ALX70796.1 chaperonin GroES [Spiroplasma turonicum]